MTDTLNENKITSIDSSYISIGNWGNLLKLKQATTIDKLFIDRIALKTLVTIYRVLSYNQMKVYQVFHLLCYAVYITTRLAFYDSLPGLVLLPYTL